MTATAQLRHALLRLGEILRTETWRDADVSRLHPAQGRMLRLLASAPQGLSVSAIAHDLGVRQPTATRSLNTLQAKGLVEKAPGVGRALAVRLTAVGRDWLAAAGGKASVLDTAVEALSAGEQAELLSSATKMIRTLQVAGAIAPQRLCVSCAYFRPNAHPDPDARHHCAMVDAAFGDRELRLDCAEHQPAAAEQAEQAWSRWLEKPDAPSAVTDEASFFTTHPRIQTGA